MPLCPGQSLLMGKVLGPSLVELLFTEARPGELPSFPFLGGGGGAGIFCDSTVFRILSVSLPRARFMHLRLRPDTASTEPRWDLSLGPDLWPVKQFFFIFPVPGKRGSHSPRDARTIGAEAQPLSLLFSDGQGFLGGAKVTNLS